MVANSSTSAIHPRRALLLPAVGLLASLNAAAQSAPVSTAAADGPNPLLWLLLAGLGIVGLMLVMTVGSAASALRWSADQAAAQAAEAALPTVAAAPVVAVEAGPAAARFAPAAAPVYSSEVVEKPVLC